MLENKASISQQTPAENQFQISRRAFITTSALVDGAVVLAAIPLVSTIVLPSLKKGVGKWVDFGKADKLTPDDFSMLSYEFLVKDGWIDLPQRFAGSGGNTGSLGWGPFKGFDGVLLVDRSIVILAKPGEIATSFVKCIFTHTGTQRLLLIEAEFILFFLG